MWWLVSGGVFEKQAKAGTALLLCRYSLSYYHALTRKAETKVCTRALLGWDDGCEASPVPLVVGDAHAGSSVTRKPEH